MFLVGFSGYSGFVAVYAPSALKARSTAFRAFNIPMSEIEAQERDDAWEHVGGDLPARRTGELGEVLFLRANPSPCDV